MGVEKAKQKKQLLKSRFTKAFTYVKDDNNYKFLHMNKDEVHLIDGSIKYEEALSMTNKFLKKTSGKSVFNSMFKPIESYLYYKRVYVIYDLPYRPPFKDIDLTRNYKSDSALFKHVNDKYFPLCEDQREKTLTCLQKKETKLNKQVIKFKHQNTKLNKKIFKNFTNPTKKELRKRKENLAERSANRSLIKENKKEIKKLTKDIKKSKDELNEYPVEIWKDGKGNPENRKIIYKYFTKKFNQKDYDPSKKVIIDGAVVNGEFGALELSSGTVNMGSQIGEGEQGIMYHIFTEKFKLSVIHSTDTDTFTYCGIYYGIEGLNIDQTILMRCKNWYFRKKEMSGPNTCRVYIVNTKVMALEISRTFSNIPEPVLTFWILWGILFGNDFIADVTKTILKNQKPETITTFLNKFFFTELKNCNEQLVQKKIVRNEVFVDNVYYNIQLNIPKIFNLVKRASTKVFKREDVIKFNSICLNTEYIAGYFSNQYRIKDPIKRRYPYPKCTLRNSNGQHIYGYEESHGRIIQSLQVPKFLLWK